ncbi:MAG: amine dehydrogenase large subunit [Pseudomonadales bacterium]|jgi:methylamine dehydrogenase heavy chain
MFINSECIETFTKNSTTFNDGTTPFYRWITRTNKWIARIAQAAVIIVASLGIPVLAEIKSESLTVETFKNAGPHGILVNSLFSSSAEIFDADTGKMLGQLSLGAWSNAVEIDKKNKLFHVAETYLSRHTRGVRTDVVTSYSFKTFTAMHEVKIPNKHASGSPHRTSTGLTDDAHFMLVYNISPAMSISVVDLRKSKFVTEIPTAGCGLIYPVGKRAFLQICGDGAMQLISLNKDGTEKSRSRSEQFFNVEADPLMEKAVRTGKGWVFPTFKGDLFRVSVKGEAITVEALFSLDEENSGWRIGGMQSIAYHSANDLLLTLMHEGGEDTHKDPGTEVWFYNLSTKRLLHKMKLDNMASAIEVSQDEDPRIYTMFIGGESLDVYDLGTGKKISSIEHVGVTPSIIQNLQL